MASVATTSYLKSIAKVEIRNTNCLRCKKVFGKPYGLYRHLWNCKIDCNPESIVSYEEAKKHANPPDYYKCKYCNEIIIDTDLRQNHEKLCDKKDLIDNLEINNINPIISYLFVIDENGKAISNVDKETGYINATLMCKSIGKELEVFMRMNSTIELINEFNKNVCPDIETINIGERTNAIISKPSLLNAKVNHIYFHELLAIPLATWCSPKYYLKVSKFIIKFKNGLVKTKDSTKAKQDIEDIKNGKLDSVTNYTNKYDPQVYFISFDINFKDINAIYYNTKEKFNETSGVIIKYGNQKKNSQRQLTHKSTYDNYKLLDSIKCYDQDNLEKYVEDLINENRIKIFDPKKISGEEYIYFKTQDEYNNLIEKTKIKAEELNKDSICDINGIDKELELKRIELAFKQEDTKQKELSIREKELDLQLEKEKTKQKELDMNKKEIKEVNNTIDKKDKKEQEEEYEEEPSIIKFNKDKKTEENPYIGVSRVYYSNKTKYNFGARITNERKTIHIGAYKTPEIAAYAYDCAREQLFGKKYIVNHVEKPKNMYWDTEKFKLVHIKKKKQSD